MQATRPSLFDLTPDDLQERMQAWGYPAYRARQVHRQLYVNRVGGLDEMTDLPRPLRETLAAETRWGNLKLERVVTCDNGLTRKALMTLPDGSPSETVLMVYPERATVCVSSQSGCPMACVFCATGKLGFLHDLSSGEIVEQVMWAERELRAMREELGEAFPPAVATRAGKRTHMLTNVVFMGMGEAFNNYANWWAAVERLHEAKGYNMGARCFTVSTVGLVPGIRKLAEEELPVNLAISLHAAEDDLRTEMMPVNKSYPVAALMQATREYVEKTNRRVSFEYVLLQEKNDAPEQAAELAEWLSGRRDDGPPLLCHVNLIPWNPVPGTPLSRSNRQRVWAFQQVLEQHHVPCTVRVERGIEIGAACGQLAGTAVVNPA